MKARSLTLLVAAIVGAFALFTTSAEAGDGRKRQRSHQKYYRGGQDYGYYRPVRHHRRVRYHRPARYVRAPVYFPLPAFQIGFAFGGGPTCR